MSKCFVSLKDVLDYLDNGQENNKQEPIIYDDINPSTYLYITMMSNQPVVILSQTFSELVESK